MLANSSPRLWIGLGLLALTVCLIGCGRSGPLSEGIEYRPRTFGTGEAAEIRVIATHGSVSIRGEGGRSRVDVTAILRASGRSARQAQQRVEELAVSMEKQGSRVELSFAPPAEANDWDESPSVRFDVVVPVETTVRIETTNGEVTLVDVHGNVDLQVANGGIHVVRANGRLKAYAERADILVETSELAVDLETRIGSIEFSGRLVGRENRLVALHGGISIAIPPDSELQIEAEAVTGGIESGLRFDGDVSGREWLATLNAATTYAFVRSTNGWIRIDALENISIPRTLLGGWR